MARGRASAGTGGTLPAVLALLIAANLLNNRLLPEAYLVSCLGAAVLLVLLARRDGCSWTDLGLGRQDAPRGLRWAGGAAGLVLAGYLVAAALPLTRDAFGDQRAAGASAALLAWHTLVRIPLGTVLLEELAFRGVLYAMLARRIGSRAAVLASSLLFGLWHVLPSLDLHRRNAAVEALVGPGSAARIVSVPAAVAGTTVAGVLFCELRRRSGSLLAPAGLHWALNGLGYGFAWALAEASA